MGVKRPKALAQVVKVLIEHKANPTALDDDGKSVLQLARVICSRSTDSLTAYVRCSQEIEASSEIQLALMEAAKQEGTQ